MATYVYCPVAKKAVLKGEDAASKYAAKYAAEAGIQIVTTGEHAPDFRSVAHSLPRKEDGMGAFWGKFDDRGRAVCTSKKDRVELEARLEGRYKWDR
jgi:hypothetical protein